MCSLELLVSVVTVLIVACGYCARSWYVGMVGIVDTCESMVDRDAVGGYLGGGGIGSCVKVWQLIQMPLVRWFQQTFVLQM